MFFFSGNQHRGVGGQPYKIRIFMSDTGTHPPE